MTPTTQQSANQRFPEGLFQPDPQRRSPSAIVAAQAKVESLLFLRHGEQQLLSMVIPLGMLIGFSLLPGLIGQRDVQHIYPMSLAIALMGAGFTGQAIAVAFDRRYGALKRIGASGVPTWALISGKICAVCAVVVVQVVILSIAAAFLGWAPDASGIVFAFIVGLCGVAAFTSFGLFLGGTLGSEMVLALANTVWFILLGTAVFATMADGLSPSVHAWLRVVPSVALTEGFEAALGGGYGDYTAMLVLLGWAVVGAFATFRTFRFTMDSE